MNVTGAVKLISHNLVSGHQKYLKILASCEPACSDRSASRVVNEVKKKEGRKLRSAKNFPSRTFQLNFRLHESFYFCTLWLMFVYKLQMNPYESHLNRRKLPAILSCLFVFCLHVRLIKSLFLKHHLKKAEGHIFFVLFQSYLLGFFCHFWSVNDHYNKSVIRKLRTNNFGQSRAFS